MMKGYRHTTRSRKKMRDKAQQRLVLTERSQLVTLPNGTECYKFGAIYAPFPVEFICLRRIKHWISA